MTTYFTRIATIVQLVALFGLVFGICGVLIQPVVAQAQSETVDLVMEKKFSGPVPAGYSESQFSFAITGPGVNQILPVSFQNAGYYSTPLTLMAGAYTIEEVGPAGFVPSDWRVQWSGECIESSEHNLKATLVVDAGNVGDGVQPCRADNQWRPWGLIVEKNVVGTSTAPSQFSFTVTQASTTYFSGAFGVGGENEIALGRGDYAVVEDPAPGYETTYSAGCMGTVGSNDSVNKYCLITNTYREDVSTTTASTTGSIIIEKQTVPDGSLVEFTFDPSWSPIDFVLHDNQQYTSGTIATGTYSVIEQTIADWVQTSAVCDDGSPISAIAVSAGETVTCTITNTYRDGGGNGNGTTTNMVFGYVWHDKNENDFWDVAQPDPLNDELDLENWTVQITDGVTTQTATTNDSGYYTFTVPTGTWTLTELMQSGWSQTFPNSSSHGVVVTAGSSTTYGPYNFGNVYFGTGGGNNESSNGGSSSGGSRRSGSGGRSNDGGSINTVTPQPLVLGAADSLMPVGAPNTGAGGSALPLLPVVSPLYCQACSLSGVGRTNIKRG